MKTVIAIRSGISDTRVLKKPKDLFSGEEIDRLDRGQFAGIGRSELFALRRKLSDTFDWLDPGDCEIGSPKMLAWERRLDKLNDLLDAVDEILKPDEEIDDEEDW